MDFTRKWKETDEIEYAIYISYWFSSSREAYDGIDIL